jgi:hypothetical protein
MAGARAGKVENRLDRQRQHRTLDEFAALGAEHGPRLGMRIEQAGDRPAASDLRSVGGQFETSLDRI